MTIDRVGGGFLLLVGLFVVWERRVLPLGTQSHPGPGYFPLLLAILLMILGGLLLLRGGRAPALRTLQWGEGRHAAAILGCSFFATFALEIIGYRIAMIIILGFLFGGVERLKVWHVFSLTLGLALGSFWVFDTFLKVPLPRGSWGF
jgi:putative tricarboxylic transport membrane protein